MQELCSQNGTVFQALGLTWCSRVATVALCSVLGWRQKSSNLLFSGVSVTFCIAMMRCTCVASGNVEKLVGYHSKGACVHK